MNALSVATLQWLLGIYSGDEGLPGSAGPDGPPGQSCSPYYIPETASNVHACMHDRCLRTYTNDNGGNYLEAIK